MTGARRTRSSAGGLWALALATLALLVAVMQVWAMPPVVAETETWYSYQSTVDFNWTATVKPGHYYPTATVTPDQLFQQRVPVEPPQYRPVLLAPIAESVNFTLPYKFEADREASLDLALKVETVITLPGYWQQVKTVTPERNWTESAKLVQGEVSFTLPLSDLAAELERARTELGFLVDRVELEVRPTWQVKATGMREPITSTVAPNFTMTYRTGSIEIDQPKQAKASQVHTYQLETVQQVTILGAPFTVQLAQSITISLLILALGLLAYLVWRRLAPRRQALGDQIWQKRLQPFIVKAESFQIPADLVVVDLGALREMARIHQQFGQPIVRVGDWLYLREGGTCYTCRMPSAPVETPSDVLASVAVSAEEPAEPER